jgi:N-acetylmuramoyl-L-alanine amidase
MYNLINKLLIIHCNSISAGKTKGSELFYVDDREWKLIHAVRFKVTKNSRLFLESIQNYQQNLSYNFISIQNKD